MERWYNGIHSEVMDKIYDGLVGRYGSIEELQKACPGWSTFSLYLTRSVECATRPTKQGLVELDENKVRNLLNKYYLGKGDIDVMSKAIATRFGQRKGLDREKLAKVLYELYFAGERPHEYYLDTADAIISKLNEGNGEG